ncbi:MAG: DUF2095 domain-containing protein [Euryarchaeota archaeon]|nr:DUF2095 domain-containing protein [Euryarchaeota archaeon]
MRKRFPALMKELKEHEVVKIDSVRTDANEGESAAQKDLSGYVPGVIDYLRRCETDEEALQIIGYLEEKGEISNDYAKRLRSQLIQKGVRSFGPKKAHGHYEKYGGR